MLSNRDDQHKIRDVAAALLFLTWAFLVQDAEDRVIRTSSLNVFQNLVHAGGFRAAGQNHPGLVLTAHHCSAEASRPAQEMRLRVSNYGRSSNQQETVKIRGQAAAI